MAVIQWSQMIVLGYILNVEASGFADRLHGGRGSMRERQ